MDALLLAAANALWQGAALAAIVAIALRAGARRNATTACVVWSVAFAAIAVLPAIDLALARPVEAVAPAPLAAASAAAPVTAWPAASIGAADAPSAPPPQTVMADRLAAGALALGGAATPFAHAWGPALLAGWGIVAGALLLRLGRAYATLARLKRHALPLADPSVGRLLQRAGHRRRATVATSDGVDVPCAIGFRRPMILIPAHVARSLDAGDLERIVLHESAHLQRYDDVANALEQIVCAVQFFQPALYVARRRIDFEREVACDDRVLEDAGEPLRYAECLARIVQLVRPRDAAVVPGFVRRPQVLARVRRIVDRSRDASPRLRAGAAIVSGAMLIATLGIARLQVPVVDPAQPAPAASPPASPAAEPPRTPARAAQPLAPPAAPRVPPEARLGRFTPITPTHGRIAPATLQRLLAERRRALRVFVPSRAKLDKLAILRIQANASAAALRGVSATDLAALHRRLRDALDATAPFHPFTPPVARVSGAELLAAIDDAKYPHPGIDDLIALRARGVSPNYVRTMGALGPSRPSLHDLIALAQSGVSSAFVRSFADAGLRGLTPQQLIALHARGVDGGFARRLGEHGYRNLTVEDLIRLKTSGFEP